MLQNAQNAYFLAKIGADTAENEQHFAEILPKTGDHAIMRTPSKCTSAAAMRPALRGRGVQRAADRREVRLGRQRGREALLGAPVAAAGGRGALIS